MPCRASLVAREMKLDNHSKHEGKEWSQTFLIGIRKEGFLYDFGFGIYDMVGYMNCFDLLRVKTQFQSATPGDSEMGLLEPSEKSARPLRNPPTCCLYVSACWCSKCSTS